MSKHLSMRSGNPALNKNTFKNITTNSEKVMTIDGTVNKISTSLFILLLTAVYTFTSGVNFIIPGLIGGFIVALITIFKKEFTLLPFSIIKKIKTSISSNNGDAFRITRPNSF